MIVIIEDKPAPGDQDEWYKDSIWLDSITPKEHWWKTYTITVLETWHIGEVLIQLNTEEPHIAVGNQNR